ncbi:unnamed protein product [Rhizoctonia solani]|uniref:histone deacetylase n=1 Tax=Rhizoctonia solani TaxID=456999 RepID=A0A8H3BKL5_9AGAM|nr:unnamed protein product [Rhizoctonia solani]
MDTSQDPIHLRTGYCYDSAMTLHTEHGLQPDDSDDHHPEKPQRITCIRAILAIKGLLERMQQIPARLVRTNEVLLVHTRDLVEKVAGLETMTDEHIAATAQFYDQLSLYVTQATSHAAALSCGGVIECALAVARGQVRNSFAIVRPPGHHAEPDEHMGFCFYNNVAVATRVILNETPIQRVLILDWDVHHGNGTQLAFEDDPNVLYISIHRYDGGEFYPGGIYGSMNSIGTGAGKGKSVNIPWPEGHMGDADYMYAFLNIVMPIAYEFAPELVFISAGFDAAAGDTLGSCDVTPACYAHMTALLSTLAGGKLVVALEARRIQPRLDFKISAGGDACAPRRPPTRASETRSERDRDRGGVAGCPCTEQVLALYPGVEFGTGGYRGRNQDSSPWYVPNFHCEHTLTPVLELFKAWRREHALKDFGFYEFPWAIPELDDYYNGQLLISGNISTQHTLVMFVHDFGNISTELLTMRQLDIKLENSWIIDTTRDFLQWCKSQEFSVIDLNMHPLIAINEDLPSEKQRRETAKDAVISAWDNLAELSDAREIVIVAHGTAGLSVMGLINERFQNLRTKVKAVVQVCGMHTIPAVPKFQDEMRRWYFKNSMVILPKDHPIYHSDAQIQRKHGQVQQSSEERVTLVMRASLPIIQQFISARVTPRSELVEGVRRRASLAPVSAPASTSQTYLSA